MINGGYHGNDAFADPNMVVFVHPPGNLPPKNQRGSKSPS